MVCLNEMCGCFSNTMMQCSVKNVEINTVEEYLEHEQLAVLLRGSVTDVPWSVWQWHFSKAAFGW